MPLFSTVSEALEFGHQYNLEGYHAHHYKKQTGYMAGKTHAIAAAKRTVIPLINITTTPDISQALLGNADYMPQASEADISGSTNSMADMPTQTPTTPTTPTTGGGGY